MMNNFKGVSILVCSLLIVGCSSEEPKTLTFDAKNYTSDLGNYVLSSGPMDELTCGFAAMLFSTELLAAMNDGQEIDDPTKFKNSTPVSLEVYSDRIVWVDTGITTPIEGSMITLTNPNGKGIDLEIVDDTDDFGLIYSDKAECFIPFS